MQTLNSEITSWEESRRVPEDQLYRHDIIATESQESESPEWSRCVDALLKIWNDASSAGDPPPSQESIEAVLRWILMED
jgi:hypothetical protein